MSEEKKYVDFGKPPEGYVAGRGRGASPISSSAPRSIRKKYADFGKPPKGYIPGAGRGAKDFKRNTEATSSSATATRRRKRARVERENDSSNGAASSAAGGNEEKEESRRVHWIDQVDGEESDSEDTPAHRLDADGEPTFTPFHLKEERSQGKFLADGSYVKFQDQESLDPWLDEVVKNKIIHEPKSGHGNAQAVKETEMSSDEAARAIDDALVPGETVTRAMQRLGKIFRRTSRKRKSWLVKKKSKQVGASEDKRADDAASTAKQTFDRLTDATSALLRGGVTDAYSMTKSLLRSRGLLKTVIEDPRREDFIWEYKWTLDTSDIHGPFTTEQMREWRQQGYFVGDYRAYVRKWRPPASTNEQESSARLAYDTTKPADDADLQSLLDDLEDVEGEDDEDDEEGNSATRKGSPTASMKEDGGARVHKTEWALSGEGMFC
eukprot:g465.t1